MNKRKRKIKNKQKIIKYLIILPILFVIYVYGLIIEKIPNEYILFEGESVNVNSSFGIKIKDDKLDEENKLTVSLFNNIPIKEIDVSVIEKTNVIPVGELIGLKLYTEGVLVVGMAEIEGEKPYEKTGIEEGDSIIEINNEKIGTASELIDIVSKSNGSILDIKYINNEQVKECSIEPIRTSVGEYKIGLWVRDSAAGVGTITYFEPETKTIGALRPWDYRY